MRHVTMILCPEGLFHPRRLMEKENWKFLLGLVFVLIFTLNTLIHTFSCFNSVRSIVYSQVDKFGYLKSIRGAMIKSNTCFPIWSCTKFCTPPMQEDKCDRNERLEETDYLSNKRCINIVSLHRFQSNLYVNISYCISV